MTFAIFLEERFTLTTHIRTEVIRVEAPITDRLRDYKPHMEKYKAVHYFSYLGR